ncbi:MAG: fibronectin type III domain-containing protein, partial [Clostridia bacterium]|nr:fibronectin type III domain-containing protein [Clostridia bacterium]
MLRGILNSGQTYYIVAGCYGDTTGEYTINAAVTTPLPPTNLSLSNKTENSVVLSWQTPTVHYANRWLIQRKVGNGSWTDFAYTSSPGYTITGLTPSTDYQFRVYGEAGGPVWEGTRSTTSSNTVTVTTSPARPTGSTATNITSDSVTLIWNVPTYGGTV